MDYWIMTLLHILLIFTSVYSKEVFNTMPPPVNTNFTCRGRDTGFYADVEMNCRVYHTCDDHGNKFTYYCPEETAFRQEALVCDHAHLVDCAKGQRISVLTDDNGKNKENVNPRSQYTDSSLNETRNTAGRSIGVFQLRNSNPAYARSFAVTAEHPPQFSNSKPLNKKQPTIVLNSSGFQRDHENFQKSSLASQNNRVAAEISKNFEKIDKKEKEENTGGFSGKFPSAIYSTTFKPFKTDFKVDRIRPNPSDSQLRNSNKKDGSIDRFSSTISSTTFRPFDMNFNVHGDSDDLPSFGKVKFGKGDGNSGSQMPSGGFDHEEMSSRKEFQFEDKRRNDEKSEFKGSSGSGGKDSEGLSVHESRQKDSQNWQSFANNNQRPSFFFDNSNFSYSETLRSMQARANKSLQPNSSTARPFTIKMTSAPTTTAGTEFPVHPFTGLLSPLVPNELDDDPYYPKRSTTTERYYKLSDRHKGEKRPFRFSTKRPWPGSLDFEIPEVLPDFNTLDDLVDRRKLFFIPRVKDT